MFPHRYIGFCVGSIGALSKQIGEFSKLLHTTMQLCNFTIKTNVTPHCVLIENIKSIFLLWTGLWVVALQLANDTNVLIGLESIGMNSGNATVEKINRKENEL